MRLAPKPPEIGHMEGFTATNDLFGYKEFGDQLANLVQAIEGPATIILDGSWGTGKTVFTLQWAGLLRQRAIPVIQIDAFELDYHEDPFTAIVGRVLASADKYLPKTAGSKKVKDEFLAASKNLGKRFLPIMAQVVLRVVSAGVVGSEEVAAVAKTLQAVRSELSETSSTALEDRVADARQGEEELNAFIAEVSKLRGALAKKAAKDASQKFDPNSPEPIVIIIDDLDRCRPDFALGMLERIKHLFGIDGIIFVLVTHLPQLEAAVTNKYGSLATEEYLEKFYQLRIQLPPSKQADEPNLKKYIEYLWAALSIKSENAAYDLDLRDWLWPMAENLELSLRSLERILIHIAFVINASTDKQFRYSGLVAGLCLMKHLRSDLYAKAQRNDLNWKEVDDFLKLTAHETLKKSNMVTWWQWVCGKTLVNEHERERLEAYQAQFHLNREQMVPYLCRTIDQFSPGRFSGGVGS